MPHSRRRQSRPRTAERVSARRLFGETAGWIRRTLARMTLDEKLGQLLMVPCHGSFLSPQSNEFKALALQVERHHVGAFIVQPRQGPFGLERSQAYPTAVLCNMLQDRAAIPLLFAADFERGTAMRLVEGTSFPHAMAVAATGRFEDAYELGRVTAREARSIGVHWLFAPVADVNSDPDNPIINVRSFGEDPSRVAELVRACVRGIEQNGALATAKHFPGHGETTVDSHIDLPSVHSDRQHIKRIELVPFRAAVKAGVSAIMTGHLAVPALEPDRELPATLSEKIVTGLLRRQMGFEGLVVSDDLDMGGVATQYAAGEAAVRAILAGCDVLIVGAMGAVLAGCDAPIVLANIEATLAGLREAAQSGRLPAARLDEAVTRILRAKARLGLHRQSRVDLGAIAMNLARPEFQQAATAIAERGITLLRNAAQLVPLDPTRPARVLLAAIAGDPDRAPGFDFEQELRPHVDALEVVRADTRFSTVDAIRLPALETYDVAVIAIFVRVADRKGSVGLPANQVDFVRGLLQSGRPAIVASFGNPYLIGSFPEAVTWLAAFSGAAVAQRATARALVGARPIGGKIPVNVPGTIPLGTGLATEARPMKLGNAAPPMREKLDPAYKLLQQAVADRAFPGGVLAVGHCGRLAVHAFGRTTFDRKAPRVTADTIYDAASLTKPVVTTTLAAILVESGQLELDAPVGRYIPEWAAGSQPDWRRRVTLRHLLTHTSGLPAHQEYFRIASSAEELFQSVLSSAFAYEPGTATVYSDPGFILLGRIVERIAGRLDALARERIFAPLAMNDTTFAPPARLRRRIAPTELDRTFRKRLVHGEVHDENAWRMGGVAGHAGMFTTARDLAAFCQMMLNGGMYAHKRLLRRPTVEQFTAPDPATGNTRTLGWMVPTENSTSGRYFSPRSYGHTGYTGTSIWVDPVREAFVVLLTNRVHPTRENTKIQQVRPAVHDAVAAALGVVLP